MKLSDLLEVVSISTMVNVYHSVTHEVINEYDWGQEWVVILIKVRKKDLMEVYVI